MHATLAMFARREIDYVMDLGMYFSREIRHERRPRGGRGRASDEANLTIAHNSCGAVSGTALGRCGAGGPNFWLINYTGCRSARVRPPANSGRAAPSGYKETLTGSSFRREAYVTLIHFA
ncbi:hypothetical protein EVAR_21575_1 [Eumeta japonica]|uniref:Uncharacterized protein n=1 Tax=Eumeta variegata TaxID=151549 RepID=A0A4C1UYP7_EUMVA|nr:hypothetical protein EVAR_21575_1 [Eumeta japonica]